MPSGRPSIFSEDVANEICDRLSEGESMLSICSDEHMPHRRTVAFWEVNKPDFYTKCARAREIGAEVGSDKMDVIASQATPEDVKCAELRISTMQWNLSKRFPKRFGNKTEVELNGTLKVPMTLAEFEARTGIKQPAKE